MKETGGCFPSSKLAVVDGESKGRAEAERLAEEAVKLMKAGRLFEAVEAIDESLQLFRIGETLYYRGVIMSKVKKEAEALLNF